ncbi:MAG: alpha/beta fold hydrolase [Actinobacteria bacterium]|nr:alpha/beta fold hydrolase [Actinomycetota bacterium]
MSVPQLLGPLERRRGEHADAPGTTEVAVPDGPALIRRKGSGAPYLWLHGTHFAGSWLPFHEQLAQRLDVVYPLHPGFVEGWPPGWLRGFDDLVLHYRDLLDALGLERIHVGGHALGGRIAANLAVFYPERVASLTLLSPFGLRVEDRPMVDFMAIDPERLGELLFNDDADELSEVLPDFDDPHEFARWYGENGVTARLMWERRYDVGLERRLARVGMPALVLAPSEDRLLPVAHAERWAEVLPAGRLATVPNTGHALLVQAPDEVSASVLAFVEEAGA